VGEVGSDWCGIRSLLSAALVCGACVAGCAQTVARPALDVGAASMLARAAKDEALVLEDPSARNAAMERALDAEVGRDGMPRERMDRLRRWLHGGSHAFHHQPGLTIPAARAFDERRGDCMTHAVLFVTMARYLGVDAYYVHATTARQFVEQGDELVATTHVAVGFAEGAEQHVVDVWTAVDGWRLATYRRIDDAAAIALYHGNLAALDMREGRLDHAERVLGFLAKSVPDVVEVQSNLAAALLRQRRYREALSVVEGALARFPTFKPLYTNGYVAAASLGDEALAAELERRGRALAEQDPIFVFARGVSSFERARYEDAAAAFEQALSAQSGSVLIQAWLVRAHLAAGHVERGVEAFARARRLAPEDARLKALALHYPELR
jgi:tetratricopeptide (TPR) repeat protein